MDKFILSELAQDHHVYVLLIYKHELLLVVREWLGMPPQPQPPGCKGHHIISVYIHFWKIRDSISYRCSTFLEKNKERARKILEIEAKKIIIVSCSSVRRVTKSYIAFKALA